MFTACLLCTLLQQVLFLKPTWMWPEIKVSKSWEEYNTTSGHKPAKSKVSAITAKPPLTNKKQVQSFIGMINYLSKFSARLSELAEPIRELSKDKEPFNWGPEHQQAFTQMKKENFKCSSVSILQPQEANSVADRCKCKRSWCLFAARRKTCIFCK